MSVLAERLPITSKNLTRGAALFLTGAMLVGSLVDCDGEGPQLPTSEGPNRQVERVTSEETGSAHLSLGGEAVMGVVESPIAVEVAATTEPAAAQIPQPNPMIG